MSKRPARNSLILTGVFLMFMSGVLTDSSAQETQPHLIAPIFPQIGGLESKLYFALVGGGDSRRTLPDGTRVPGIQVDEYQESWMNPALSCGADYLPEPNNVIVHHRILSLDVGLCTANGWLRVHYSGGIHTTHGYVLTRHEDRDDEPFITPLVRPAAVFRLIVTGAPHEETGIAIVNPTEVAQAVTVTYYQSGQPPLLTRQGKVTIDPWSKVSRFLSDLVDLEGLDDIGGAVRIQGETGVAVAAVRYSRKTKWFQAVPVSAEP